MPMLCSPQKLPKKNLALLKSITMKLVLSAALLAAMGVSDAFVVSRTTVRPTSTCINAAVTFEEDLELTRQVIFKHIQSSDPTASAPKAAAAVKETKPAAEPKAAVAPEPEATAAPAVDISIPYDAAARLEFDASHKEFDAKKFEAFKAEYYTKTVAMVTAKKVARESAAAPAAKAAPAKKQDAPAKEAAAPAAKKAVAPKTVPSSSSVDLSIDYDAAAKLAFTKKFGAFDEAAFAGFKKEYEAGTVAMITAKQQARKGDLSVPYDAAARLAFMIANDNVFDEKKYAKFKKDYEAKAVKEVSAKHKK
jgi:hypothetical protein